MITMQKVLSVFFLFFFFNHTLLARNNEMEVDRKNTASRYKCVRILRFLL